MQTGEACEMLKIYVGDDARWEGHSLHTALLRCLLYTSPSPRDS